MRARKVDKAQAEIVQALEQAGYCVTDLSSAGKGIPDLLVSRNGVLRLVEVKTGERKYYFTPAQLDYMQSVKAPIYVIRSINEVESFISGELKPVNR